MLADHNKDRAEDKASRCEEKIRRLQEELQSLNRGVSSLAASGERAAEMDDDVQDKIREIKKKLDFSILSAKFKNVFFSRISEAEVRAETEERVVMRLQRERDYLQV